MKKLHILISSLVATISMPLVSMVGCNPDHDDPISEPEVQSFESDPWETVCYYANQGLDKLCSVYACKPSDLIGKTRTLSFNGLQHEVMVIGTNEDIYKVDGANHFCTLTFQFKTLLSTSLATTMNAEWNQGGSSVEYWKSTIHTFLNSEDEKDKSVYAIMKSENPWVEQYLHLVVRQVNKNEDIGYDIIPGTEKIFMPVLSDLFSLNGLYKSNDTIFTNNYVPKYYYENIRAGQYSYYKNNIKDGVVVDDNMVYKSYPCLKRTPFGADVYDSYWLCSPTLGYSSYAWSVNTTGQVVYEVLVSHPLALAPCFCI